VGEDREAEDPLPDHRRLLSELHGGDGDPDGTLDAEAPPRGAGQDGRSARPGARHPHQAPLPEEDRGGNPEDEHGRDAAAAGRGDDLGLTRITPNVPLLPPLEKRIGP